jgi:hypothetical protein
MENFEEKQSKYGKIYKVAGPRKYTIYRDPVPRFVREQAGPIWMANFCFVGT